MGLATEMDLSEASCIEPCTARIGHVLDHSDIDPVYHGKLGGVKRISKEI
jgi:hypothetical protein